MATIYYPDVDNAFEKTGEWFVSPSSDEPLYIGRGIVKLPPIYSVSTGGTATTLPEVDEIIIKGTDIAANGGDSVSEAAIGDDAGCGVWIDPNIQQPELF